MITIDVKNLPFRLPNNQIIYIETEYNEFLNSCFSHTDEFQRLLSQYYSTIQSSALFEDGCEFIYVPQLIKSWNRPANINRLRKSLNYNYPTLKPTSINIDNSLRIDTVAYTNFLLKLFDKPISEQITNGLLLYSILKKEFIYLPLTANTLDSLLKEIGLFFNELREYCDIKIDESENFSLIGYSEERHNVPDDEKTDYDFPYEGNSIVKEIRDRIELLKKSGHEKLLLRLILDEISKIDSDSTLKVLVDDILFYRDFYTLPIKEVNRIEKFKEHYLTPQLSTIVIDEKYRIILPEYNNLEIKMSPLPKAVYFLFMRHQEGILFKHISRYKTELYTIYSDISNRECTEGIEKSIQDICNPAENSINEKCSRIKEAFLSQFDDEIANNYYITGDRGCPKGVILSRNLIKWNASFSYDDGFYIDDDYDGENW